MDELAEIKAMIETFRETLTFLVEQEKIRGEEVNALNDKIEAVNSTLVNQVINPSIEAYKEQQFQDFNDKYGEKLNQYDDTIKLAQNDPEYSSSRAAWEQMNADVPPEEMENFDTDGFVDQVTNSLAEYVDGIKSSLGLAKDTPVEIKQDGNGDLEVKADVDGNGKMEEVKKQIILQFGEKPLENSSYGKIINEKHFKRLCTSLSKSLCYRFSTSRNRKQKLLHKN